MEKTVSIIVALYNSGEYMRKCIDSLLQQTLKDIEIILVNDCSPDNSLEIAEEYKKKYPDIIRIINHDKNERAGTARNNGLKAASGKYVWFVDADDWLAPTALEEAYSLIEETQGDIVSVDYYEITDENNEPTTLVESVPDSCVGIMDNKKKNEYIAKVKAGFSKLIRREFLLKYKLFYPEGILFEDNGIVPLLGAMAARVDVIHKGLYYYRIGNPNSQTGRKRSESVMIDRMKAMEYFWDKSKELGIIQEMHAGIEYVFIFIYYASIVRYYIKGSCEISRATFSRMKSLSHKYFPGFRNNKYIKDLFPTSLKVSLFAAELGFPIVNGLKKVYNMISK